MNAMHTMNLNIAYEERVIVENLNMAIPQGKITALVGANGSGKSTILKTMARIMSPAAGQSCSTANRFTSNRRGRLPSSLAILPQNPAAPDGLTYPELVSYWRFPYQKGFGSLTRDDRSIIQWSLEATGMTGFADRPIDQLSGGQRQRAWIAMALAQQTDILFLDEPTTYLDMAHQLEVLELLQRLNASGRPDDHYGVHDLNHASRYAHHMVAIKKGKVVGVGTPRR